MQKIHIFLIFIFFSVLQLNAQNLDRELEAIIAPLITSISGQSVKNIAIADFTLLDGTPTELGKYLAEEFTYSLVNAPKRTFTVIDRSKVATLLKENNHGRSGKIDPSTIAKLGKMLGIDAVLAGTLTSTGNSLRLIIKVWNLETQGVVAVSKGDISKTPMIIELEGKTVSLEASQSTISSSTVSTKKEQNLAEQTIDGVKLIIYKFEQIGSKATFYFTLENKNAAKSIREWHVHSNFSAMNDQDGNAYKCKNIILGNGQIAINLVHDNPVKCYLEFNVGVVKITKAAYLKIGSYRGTFEFTNLKVN